VRSRMGSDILSARLGESGEDRERIGLPDAFDPGKPGLVEPSEMTVEPARETHQVTIEERAARLERRADATVTVRDERVITEIVNRERGHREVESTLELARPPRFAQN
jgi:hypothetical protein